MSETKEKAIYIGNGKVMKPNWMKSSLCLTDIPQEHIFEYNGKKYIKVNINVKDEADQWGKDLSITVDTFKPEVKAKEEAAGEEAPDSLPF